MNRLKEMFWKESLEANHKLLFTALKRKSMEQSTAATEEPTTISGRGSMPGDPTIRPFHSFQV